MYVLVKRGEARFQSLYTLLVGVCAKLGKLVENADNDSVQPCKTFYLVLVSYVVYSFFGKLKQSGSVSLSLVCVFKNIACYAYKKPSCVLILDYFYISVNA